MIQVVKCPSCAAPLQADDESFERCDFCGSRIVISPQNTVSPDSFGFDGLLNQAHKLKEILRLTRTGRKIEAIKIYREAFGGGLAEAKEAVEKLVDGKPLDFTNFQMFSISPPSSNYAGSFGQAENLNDILNELRRGNKINAIRIYREKFGVGLKEAKDAVEAMERGKNINLHVSKSSQINDQPITKTTKTVGWITGIAVFLGLIGALAGIGAAIFAVINATKSALPVPTPIVNGKASFATEILRFGGEGSFKDNRLIAVDGAGRIYSADYNGGLLQQFDGNGKFLAQWNIGENINLQDLIADRKNRVYVLSSNKLAIYDGATQQILSSIERPNYQSLALDANGKFYAITYTNELTKLDEHGKSLEKPISLSKQLNYEAGKLNGLTIDGAGNFYVYDSDKKSVLKYSPDAKFLARFDNPSNKDKKFNSIYDLAVDGKGRIFVAEVNEIHVYDNDGRYIDSIETRQSLGITFDERNALWTASRPFIVKYELKQ